MNSEDQMIEIIKIDIAKLKEKMLQKATDILPVEMHEGKNIAEEQRRLKVRAVRSILKEKLDTLDIIERTNKYLYGEELIE